MNLTELCAFMTRNRYGVVSWSSAEGSPQSALVGIAVSRELEIVFDTVQSSRKYGNLRARPECSFVVGWDGEQTVQFEGLAFEPEGEELERCLDIYFAVWPEGRARRNWPGIAYFVVRPLWVRFCDYGVTPAVVEEMRFGV
jgi:hypothetical protein